MTSVDHIIKKIQEYFQDHFQSVRLSNNIITYLICVIISSIVWLLSSLNKEYSTVITYPIKYINLPKDKYAVSELPQDLQMNIQAKGFVLIGYKLKTSFLPITLNFDTYNKQLEFNNGLFEYTLFTNQLKDKIDAQINSDIKLVDIYPESIDFKFAYSKQKKVAIRPQIDYTLKSQYILTQIKTTPDSIWVSGAETVIDTLQFIPTLPAKLEKLSKNTTVDLELEHRNNLQFDEGAVKVLLEIEQFTAAQKSCQIKTLNQPDSISLRLFPSKVNITYNVGLSKYDKIEVDDFVFAVEYPQDSKATFLEVKVLKKPAYIENLTFSPQKVEYLLEKR